MKCYVLAVGYWQKDKHTRRYRYVGSRVGKVFANIEDGKNYIHKCWPKAVCKHDDVNGEYYLRKDEITQNYTRYQLEERDIEGL